MSVCSNQDEYNKAYRNALKYNDKENMKQSSPWIYIYVALYLIFFVWGIILAMQVPAGPGRTLNIAFAMFLGPIYVLSYYFGMLRS
jgi:bacteriorhodopsin